MPPDPSPHPVANPIPSKPLPIEDFLGPVFELAGIKGSKRISLSLYVSSGGHSVNIKITTFQSFLQLLGASVGTYQIALDDPEIEGLDIRPFRISFMTIGFDYDPKTGFQNPNVHTDIEEFHPETNSPEKLRERATKLAGKAVRVLEFISLFRELARIAGLG